MKKILKYSLIGVFVLFIILLIYTLTAVFEDNSGCPAEPGYSNSLLMIKVNEEIIDITEENRNLLTDFFNNKADSYDEIKSIAITRWSTTSPHIFISIEYNDISNEDKYLLINELKEDISDEEYFSMIWLDKIDCIQ